MHLELEPLRVLVMQINIQQMDLLVYECALLDVLDAQEMVIINVIHAKLVTIYYQPYV